MKSTSPTHNEPDKSRRRWEWLVLVLALLLSFGCVFCSSQLALSIWPDRLASASMLANRQADYGSEPNSIWFAEVDPGVAVQAATDVARLHITPPSVEEAELVTVGLLPATPTPTVKPGPRPRLPDATTGTPTVPTTVTPVPTIDSTAIVTPRPPSTVIDTTDTPQPTPISTPTVPAPLPTGTATPGPPTSTPVPPPTDPSAPTPDGNDDDPPPSPPANNPPIVRKDRATTDEDNAVKITVLSNDRDDDGTLIPSTVSVVSGPSNGITSVNTVTGKITYIPALNFNGTDSFTYQVCDNDGACDPAKVTVTVNPVNDPPVAVADTAFTAEDTSENINVRINDSDVDSSLLTVLTVSPAPNGTATTDGSLVTYDPTANFNGTDVFTYTVSDGDLTDTAMVTVTVIPVNDPPVAVADAYTTTVGITLTVSTALGVLTNDFDVDTADNLTAFKMSDPMSGTLTLNGDGSFTYVPNGSFLGVDIFTYRAKDTIMAPSNVTTVTITFS